jgi:uncharacterized protein (DUF983 family)
MKFSMIKVDISQESEVWVKSITWGIFTAVLSVTLLGLMSL